jgi:hypothetical protein
MLASFPTGDVLAQHPLYATTVLAVAGIAAIVFPLLFFVSAPYGRHARGGWGPVMPAKLAWVVMEAPSPILFAVCLATAPSLSTPVLVLATLYLVHYVNRSFVFPFRMRGSGKTKPVFVALLAALFNLANGSTNGFALAQLAPHLTDAWLWDPRFWLGVSIFLAGFWINQESDEILRRLRPPGVTGYRIPYGGMYRYVSSPNYLGEILEWVGFAIAAWTVPAWVFVVFTMANLVPRALTHHQWYRDRFEGYPPERKAIFPGWL